MISPLVLVTAAAGKTGAAVTSELIARGWPVRALVRRHDARSRALEALGADVVAADLFDPEQMAAATRGVRRAYWCPPFHPHGMSAVAVFADTVRARGVESVVRLSQWLAGPSHPSFATRQAWLTDRLFAGLQGVGYTSLTPGFFADNYLRLIGFAAQLGVLPSLTGDSLNAPPSTEDIARVAVEALTDPDAHAGRSYRPTGPALLHTGDMARILTDVLGREVRRVEMPMWLFLKAARMQGVSAFELSGLRYWVEDARQGAFGHCHVIWRPSEVEPVAELA